MSNSSGLNNINAPTCSTNRDAFADLDRAVENALTFHVPFASRSPTMSSSTSPTVSSGSVGSVADEAVKNLLVAAAAAQVELWSLSDAMLSAGALP